MYRRMTALCASVVGLFAMVMIQLFYDVMNKEYLIAGAAQGTYTLEVGHSNGCIYDCNMKKLVNEDVKYYAALNPTPEAAAEILPYVTDKDEYYAKLVYGKPFVCEVSSKEFESEDIVSFEIPERYSENQLAQHIIGYVQNGEGVSGIEYAYNDFLRSYEGINRVTYNVDGRGTALEGIGNDVETAQEITAGVVLTLDRDIQEICEEACESMEKGAVVVMDIYTGDILGMASAPTYDVNALYEAVNDDDSPMINRCLYSYNVGSIFKLVTAQTAFEQGLSMDFSYECTGDIEIGDCTFRCHDLSGHKEQNLTEAMRNSCNTYFIDLSSRLDTDLFLDAASRGGFGKSITLAAGMTASGGNLQTKEDLRLPAEKANLSFGQGKLLASPLQICAYTCAIANEGYYCVPRLVMGVTENGVDIKGGEKIRKTRIMERETAFSLQDLMIAAVDGNKESNARPSNCNAAGKTSTAQTGQYDKSGEEICHGWITGFFPLSTPKYAVTVLCEGGGYGNLSAAPVFREIAEQMTKMGD